MAFMVLSNRARHEIEKTKMYEWENKIDTNAITIRIQSLRAEIKRVSSTTLRGDFSNPEDREYWVKKLTKMNSELSALEQMK